jgi:YD repeat-containing protein
MAMWTFTYDPVGNHKNILDLIGNTVTYSYDNKYRLLAATSTGPNPKQYRFTYDSMDNRVTSNDLGSVATWSYDLSGRITTNLANSGYISSYSYSANGNMIGVNESTGLTTMSYDFENRLQTHQSGATGTTTYLYYTDNMKAIENASGSLTTLIWDGSDYLQGRS